ncbi:Uncharacterised protein [Mycobacteroides abscessus subsp. abscessus]|nr:Uncharacterised protein [Mycobacteroides abscessus subsp. abscessus]
MISGAPIFSAVKTSSASESAPTLPGTTGSPAAATVPLALILSPIASMASAGGPTKTIPAA